MRANAAQKRQIAEDSFANSADHAAKMRSILSGNEDWRAEKYKPADPFSPEAGTLGDVISAKAFLSELRWCQDRTWRIQNSAREYVRAWRDIVSDHEKNNPAWAAEMKAVLDEIEAEAAKG